MFRAAVKYLELRFPLSLLQLQMFAEMLLDQQGNPVAKLINIFREDQWAYSLLNIYKTEYFQRLAANIKKQEPPCNILLPLQKPLITTNLI